MNIFCKKNRHWHSFCVFCMMFFLLMGQIFATPAHALFDFGIKDEKELGRKFEVLIRSQLPLIEDPEVSLYVKGIVDRLAKVIPPQPFPFKSGVVLHNSLNAFAVPGGNIFVFSGLIMQLDNEAELAGIIAHEMAHVTQRHVADRIERSRYMSVASVLLAIAGVAVGGGEGAAIALGAMGAGQSAMLNYSRMDETEADDIGYQYLVAAGYPPVAMAGGFKKIYEKSAMSGGNRVPTYLSTHPDIGSRIASVIAKVQTSPRHLQQRKVDNRRFKRVQTLLWARYGNIQAATHRFAAQGGGLALMGTAMLQSRQNNVHAATASFDKAVATAPNDALILREAGTFHYRKGDMQRAEKLLVSALQKDPRDYMAQYYYARLLDETGRTPQAEPFYKTILRKLPQESEVHTAYGRSLGRSGKHFLAYLHLAYGAMYAKKKKLAKEFRKKAQGSMRSDSERQAMNRFNRIYKEYKEIWEDGL